MTIQIPSILNNESFLIDENLISWDETKTDYFAYKIQNDKLVDQLWKLNHKATVGLATALSEWILWRFSKDHNISVPLNSLEAMWLGLVNKYYLIDWGYNKSEGETIWSNILWVVFSGQEFIRSNYIHGNYQIQWWVMNLAMLARYITPNKTLFDNWFNDCLVRLTQFFPTQYNRGDVMDHPKNYPEFYDSSHEPPIPREFFFEPDFDYEKADIDGLLSQFMAQVNHINSPFFRKAENMLEKGFVGIPYIYPQPK
ncbi:hypothetical protein RCS94_06335 [Orbaceae bacterium ac157xtp]